MDQSESAFFDWPIRYLENFTESWYIFHPNGFPVKFLSVSGTHFRVLFSDFSSVDSFSVLSFPGTILFRRPWALDSRRAIFDGAFKTGGPPNFTSEVRSKYDCLIQGSTDTFQTVIVWKQHLETFSTWKHVNINRETSILSWKHQYWLGNIDTNFET